MLSMLLIGYDGLHHLPPLRKSRPRLACLIITWVSMEWREIIDVEGGMHRVLVIGEVELVCIVVDALDDLEGAITSWLELGVTFVGEAIFA